MQNHKEKYWNGTVNKLCRYWFYLMRGVDIFNQFKYLVAAIFALYWMLKMKNPAILAMMFLICIPVLFVVGYYSVHYVGKVVDWLNVEFSSYWSRYQFELQERQVKATEDIRDIISSPIDITAVPSEDCGINAVAHEAHSHKLKTRRKK